MDADMMQNMMTLIRSLLLLLSIISAQSIQPSSSMGLISGTTIEEYSKHTLPEDRKLAKKALLFIKLSNHNISIMNDKNSTETECNEQYQRNITIQNKLLPILCKNFSQTPQGQRQRQNVIDARLDIMIKTLACRMNKDKTFADRKNSSI